MNFTDILPRNMPSHTRLFYFDCRLMKTYSRPKGKLRMFTAPCRFRGKEKKYIIHDIYDPKQQVHIGILNAPILGQWDYWIVDTG